MARKKIASEIDVFLDKEEKKQYKYRADWIKRNKNWDDKAPQILKILKEVQKKVNDSKKSFNNLYVTSSDHTLIQLSFGSAHIGKKLNNKNASELENGATLLYTKGIDGTVLCCVYPCESEQKKMLEDYIIYKIYKSAADIGDDEVMGALKFLFSYHRISSAMFGASRIEKAKYWYYNIKGKFLKWLFKKFLTSFMKGAAKSAATGS